MSTYLVHHGIKGMKWGVRRYQNEDGSYTSAGRKRRGYRSTSIRSAVARMQNRKVDKSFEQWKTGSTNRENAIDLGKNANVKKIEYERNRDRDSKREYKSAKKLYKKAYKDNTTYRKGQIRGEVGSDLSRKYLSEAKKVEKKLQVDPNNKELRKEYTRLMNAHDVERAKARKAPSVGAKRSAKIASYKRALTITAKAAAASVAVGIGVSFLKSKNVNISMSNSRVMDYISKGLSFLSYMY